MKHRDIIEVIEDRYPVSLAEKWDKTGLQVGSLYQETTGVVIALDCSIELIQEASEKGCNLIITHHPLTLSSLYPLSLDTYLGQMISLAIQTGITIYSAHTNFDAGDPSVSDYLLDQITTEYFGKKVLIPLHNNLSLGFGKTAHLSQPKTCFEIINMVKKSYPNAILRFTGNSDSIVSKIAVMGGSGSSFIKDAISTEAELYITGDMRYHDAQFAIQEGINVLDMGHFYSELGALVLLQELVMTRFGNINISLYDKESNPFISWR